MGYWHFFGVEGRAAVKHMHGGEFGGGGASMAAARVGGGVMLEP